MFKDREIKNWDPKREPFNSELYDSLSWRERRKVIHVCDEKERPTRDLAFEYHISQAKIASILNWFEKEKVRYQQLKQAA